MGEALLTTDQSHLRKYLTTLGIAVIAGTLSLAGLFFRLQQDLLVTQSQLKDLTPTARGIVGTRQTYLAVATTLLPIFVLLGLVAGLSLTIFGVKGWARRQQVADEREDLERNKLQVELRNMTPQERVEKLNRDAEEAVAPNEPTGTTPADDDSMPAFADRAAVEVIRSKVSNAELELLHKLSAVFPTAEVNVGVKVESQNTSWFYDAVVVGPAERFVFELKYASNPKNVRNRIMDGIAQVARGASLISAQGVFVLVVADMFADVDVGRWFAQAQEIASDFRVPPRVLIWRESEWTNLSASALGHLIERAP